MKKLAVIITLALILATGTAFAEFDILSYPGSLEGGNLLIDIAVGLGADGLVYGGGSMKIPPSFLTIGYCLPIPVPISVGGYASISQYGRDWDGGYKERNTYWGIGTQGDWHWGFDMDWMDLYTGLSMGYKGRIYNYTGDDKRHKVTSPTLGYIDPGFHGGIRFFFTPNIGLGIEVGHPTWLKAGLALKF